MGTSIDRRKFAELNQYRSLDTSKVAKDDAIVQLVRDLGVTDADVQKIGDGNSVIEGQKEWEQLYDRLRDLDQNQPQKSGTIDRATQLYQAITREKDQQPVAADNKVAAARPGIGMPGRARKEDAVREADPMGAMDNAVQPYLDAFRAVRDHKARPKGIEDKIWDTAHSLNKQHFTEDELTGFIQNGEKDPAFVARMQKVNAQFGREGEWTAQNSIEALYDLRKAQIAAYKGESIKAKALAEADLKALPSDSSDRPATQAKIDSLKKEISGADEAIAELEDRTKALHYNGRIARKNYGKTDIKRADELDVDALAAEKKGDTKRAEELRAEAGTLRHRGAETLYHAGKHVELFMVLAQKSGKPIPKWMQSEYKEVNDGVAYAQIVAQKHDTQKLKDAPPTTLLPVAEPPKLTAAPPAHAKELPGAGYVIGQVNKFVDGANNDQGHLAITQQWQNASYDYHKIGADKAGFFSDDKPFVRGMPAGFPEGMLWSDAIGHARAMFQARNGLKGTIDLRLELYGDVTKLGGKDQATVGDLNAQRGDIRVEELKERQAAAEAEKRLQALLATQKGLDETIFGLVRSKKDAEEARKKDPKTPRSIDEFEDDEKQVGKQFGTETVDLQNGLDQDLNNVNGTQAGDIQYTDAQNAKAVAVKARDTLVKRRDENTQQIGEAGMYADAAWETVTLARDPTAKTAKPVHGDGELEAGMVQHYAQLADANYGQARFAYKLAKANLAIKGTKLEQADLDKTIGYFSFNYAGWLGTSAQWDGASPGSKWRDDRNTLAHDVLKEGDAIRTSLTAGTDDRVAMSKASAGARAIVSEAFVDVDPKGAYTDLTEGRDIVKVDVRPFDVAAGDALDARLGNVAFTNLDTLDRNIDGEVDAQKIGPKTLDIGDKFLGLARAVLKDIDPKAEGAAVLKVRVDKLDAELKRVSEVRTVGIKQWRNGEAFAVARGKTITDDSDEKIDKSYNEIGRGWWMIGSGIFHSAHALVTWDSSKAHIDDPQGDKQREGHEKQERLHEVSMLSFNMGKVALTQLNDAYGKALNGKLDGVGPIEFLWTEHIALAGDPNKMPQGMKATYDYTTKRLAGWTGYDKPEALLNRFNGGLPPVLDAYLHGNSVRPTAALEMWGDDRIAFLSRTSVAKLGTVVEFNKDVSDTAKWAAPLNNIAETLFITVMTMGMSQLWSAGRGAQIGMGLIEGAEGVNGALQAGRAVRMATSFGKLLAVQGVVWGANKIVGAIAGENSAAAKLFGFASNFVGMGATQEIAGIKSVVSAVLISEAQMGAQTYFVPWVYDKAGLGDQHLAIELTGLVVGALIPVGAGEIFHGRQVKANEDRAARLVEETLPHADEKVAGEKAARVANVLANYQRIADGKIPSLQDTAVLKGTLAKELGVGKDNAKVGRMVDRMQLEAAAQEGARKVFKGALDENTAPSREQTMKVISESARVLEAGGMDHALAMQRAAEHWAMGLYGQATNAATAGANEKAVHGYLDAANAAAELGHAAAIAKDVPKNVRPAAEAVIASVLGDVHGAKGALAADYWSKVQDRLTADPKDGGAGLDAKTAQELLPKIQANAFADAVKQSLFSREGLMEAMTAPQYVADRFIEKKAQEIATRLGLRGADAEALVKSAKTQLAESHAASLKVFKDAHASEIAKTNAEATDTWIAASADLTKQEAATLRKLSPAAQSGLREIPAKQAAKLVERLGAEAVEKLAPALGGELLNKLGAASTKGKLAALAKEFSADELRKMAQDIGGDTIARLMNSLSMKDLRVAWQQLGPVLGRWSNITAKELNTMKDTFGWAAMRWAGESFDLAGAKQLFADLGGRAGAERMMTDNVDSARARLIVDVLGVDTVRAILPNGSADAYLSMLGTESARGVAAHRLGNNEAARLSDHARRLNDARQPGGALENPQPLANGSVVFDSVYMRYVATATEKLARGEQPTPVERAAYNDFHSRRGVDARVANMTVAELPENLPYPAHRGFELAVARDSAEYRSLLQRLADARVGGEGNGAAADRSIAADLFFANGARPPTFVSADHGMLTGLLNLEVARRMQVDGLNRNQALRAILDPGNTVPRGRTPDVFTPGAAGFNVTDPVSGRTIRVVGIRS